MSQINTRSGRPGATPDVTHTYPAVERGEVQAIISVRTAHLAEVGCALPAALAVSTGSVLHPAGKTLYFCNRFNGSIDVIDLEQRRQTLSIRVQREPMAAVLTRDARHLLVANHLPSQRADLTYAGASVSVISLESYEVVKELHLPDGSTSVKSLSASPDKHYAVLAHIIAQTRRPTVLTPFGWINGNAITLLDLEEMSVLGTVLLDEPSRGAANPWGTAWSGDGKYVLVTHAGTHEVSIIRFESLLSRIMDLPAPMDPSFQPNGLTEEQLTMARSVPFCACDQIRIHLPKSDRGPRDIAVLGTKAYVTNYFSDTLSVIDLEKPGFPVESIKVGPAKELTLERKGEMFFNDGTISYRGWQSCASCHPDGRVDGLNWDLLNDGIGNPKNTKSMLLAHRTPPAMSLGVRASAEVAVRAGIEHILFTKQPEEVAIAIDAYLKSLQPVPSPYLIEGKLSPSAVRGEKVFVAKAHCATCHPSGLFTDQKLHDVGTRGPKDKATDRFDTPTLIELWRTAPYLHDGSAATVRDVVTMRNHQDQHGHTSQLSSSEIDDLCAYLLSL